MFIAHTDFRLFVVIDILYEVRMSFFILGIAFNFTTYLFKKIKETVYKKTQNK